MSIITKPPIHILNGLTIKEGIELDDVMAGLSVGQFSVSHYMAVGIDRLKNILLDPGCLKIEIPDSSATVLENTLYHIGGVFDGQLTNPVAWRLESREDFEVLKSELKAGRYLCKRVSEGYTVILTKEHADTIELVSDMRLYWHDLVAEYINQVIQEITPWQLRPAVKPYSRFIDVDDCIKQKDGSTKNNEMFLTETLEELLFKLCDQVVAFVRQDPMSLMIATPNSRGIQITRYGNAVAIRHVLDIQQEQVNKLQQED